MNSLICNLQHIHQRQQSSKIFNNLVNQASAEMIIACMTKSNSEFDSDRQTIITFLKGKPKTSHEYNICVHHLMISPTVG